MTTKSGLISLEDPLRRITVRGTIDMKGSVLPYKKLMGMYHWMGSHFHDWGEYNGVAFSIELLEWGRKFKAVWVRL